MVNREYLALSYLKHSSFWRNFSNKRRGLLWSNKVSVLFLNKNCVLFLNKISALFLNKVSASFLSKNSVLKKYKLVFCFLSKHQS